MTIDDPRRCATFGHVPGPWINYPIDELLPPVTFKPPTEPPVFQRIRYISKRVCQRCGAVDVDRSHA